MEAQLAIKFIKIFITEQLFFQVGTIFGGVFL